jgi:SAM-dependent methyltransferase
VEQRWFGRMAALADPLRSRVLLALEGYELSVTELCSVFQLPQSTMSRQLKLLADEGWVIARAEGPVRRYSISKLAGGAAELWRVVREEVGTGEEAAADLERIRAVLADRRSRSQRFFSEAASEWDRMRRDLVGRRGDLHGLLGLVDDRWAVADLGCGTGEIASLLAPFVDRVVAVDDSPEMVATARRRLAERSNVEVRAGALEELPLSDGEVDAALIFLVLAYVADPAGALHEAARVVRPGGRVVVVDLTRHGREEYRHRFGHGWLGFSAGEIEGWAGAAGLTGVRYLPLPADPEAKGPTLFVATGRVMATEPGALPGRASADHKTSETRT